MKGKIDKNGFLYIERENGKYKIADCPRGSQENPCGDWCALFEEPEKIKKDPSKNAIYLPICNEKTLVFDYFSDERKDPNNYEIDIQADLVQEICKRYWDLQERIEIIGNIAKQIDSNEYESLYSKESEDFANNVIVMMSILKEQLWNDLESDVIEFGNNGDE